MTIFVLTKIEADTEYTLFTNQSDITEVYKSLDDAINKLCCYLKDTFFVETYFSTVTTMAHLFSKSTDIVKDMNDTFDTLKFDLQKYNNDSIVPDYWYAQDDCTCCNTIFTCEISDRFSVRRLYIMRCELH